MKSLILAVLLSIAALSANALTKDQQSVKQIAEQVGSQVCVEEQCFGKTLQAIAWQESTFGINIIGNSKGAHFYYKQGDKDIKIAPADTFVKNDQRFTKYDEALNRGVTRVYVKSPAKPIYDGSLGAFQIKVQTAKRVIKEMNLTMYSYIADDDTKITNKLLTDTKFGATIAAHYLKLNYLVAKKSGSKNPWFFAVSKYNGGAHNTTYVNLISGKMQRL